ncbi:MAG: hypothetical protein KJ063_02385 [Anaerolineae bacterium]|nr:hypothetical protein [Anaerolineae bacterium]
MSNTALTYWQAGIEATKGTAVAATRKPYTLGGVPQEKREKVYIDQGRQNFIANFDAVETHVLVDGFELQLPGSPFTDLPFWFQGGIKGGVAASGAGPYLWTFNDAAASDDLASYTLEVNDTVGSFRLPYCMIKSWEMSGKGGSGPTLVDFKMELLAQRLTAGHTMTAAIADRDLRGQYMPFKNSQLFMDTTAGGIGTTEIAASLEEWNIKVDNGIEPRFTGSASGGYFTTHRRGERYCEFSAVLLFNAATYAEFSTNFQANVGRFIQLKNTGAANNLFTFNLYSKPETFEFQDDGATRRVAIMGRSVYDPTLGYSFQTVVQNDIATL